MRVLVACEYSGTVRDAFLALGHDAMSCDLLPTDVPGPHHQGDVRNILGDKWDLMIAHPPCTYLTCSAEWAYGDGPYHQKVKPSTLVGAQRRQAREEALDFVNTLLNANIKQIALENPRGVISSRIRKPNQTIQPYNFGEDASKATCLWLANLPSLCSTRYYEPRITLSGVKRWSNQTDSGQNTLPPSKDRWKIRSATYRGIAAAMAHQWGRQ